MYGSQISKRIYRPDSLERINSSVSTYVKGIMMFPKWYICPNYRSKPDDFAVLFLDHFKTSGTFKNTVKTDG